MYAQKGKFNSATKYHNAAANRMQTFGEEDEEVLKLYNQAIDEYKKCILNQDKNTGKAYHYLGRILYTAPLSLRNYVDATTYLYEALDIHQQEKDNEYIALCFNEIGSSLFRLGDYNSSFINYKKASELSDLYAGSEAFMYWLGVGTEQNLPKAMEKYRAAAIAGIDVWANIYALSYHINEIAKGNDYNEAMNLYFEYLSCKESVAKDVWMSKLTQAADLGCPPAQVDLWVCYRDDKMESKGMPYLQKALDAQYVPAFFHIGYVYHLGLNNTKIDYTEAQKWYEKAAVEGFPIAQSNLGALYYSNLITAPQEYTNKDLLYYWWTISAEQGYNIAKYNLTLLPRYQAPQSKLERAFQILNSITSIINTSAELYNSIDKSINRSYTPSFNQTQQAGQTNSSTTNTSETVSDNGIKTPCSRCHGSGECQYSYSFGLNFCHGKGELECVVCNGKGFLRNGTEKCRNCDGKGRVECGVCYGTGKCSHCGGTGTGK